MYHDANVLRTAECWTDHELLRVKLKLCPPLSKPQAKRVERLDAYVTSNTYSIIISSEQHIQEHIATVWV